MTKEQKEALINLHNECFAAAEKDSENYIEAAANLGYRPIDGAISARKSGYYLGMKETVTKYAALLEEKDRELERQANELRIIRRGLQQIKNMSDPGSHEKAITDMKAIAAHTLNTYNQKFSKP